MLLTKLKIVGAVLLLVGATAVGHGGPPGPAGPAKVVSKSVAEYPAPKDETTTGHPGAAISPDGQRIARVHGGRLRVYAVGTREPLFTSEAGAAQGAAVAFAPDGKWLAFEGANGRVEIVSAAT